LDGVSLQRRRPKPKHSLQPSEPPKRRRLPQQKPNERRLRRPGQRSGRRLRPTRMIWHSAVGEAKDQRVEATKTLGLARAEMLSGAASFCKENDEKRPATQPTREEFIHEALAVNGLRFVRDDDEEPHEAAEWDKNGGAEADEVARRDAWAASIK